METQRMCPSCRKPLPLDVPLGLCPECLIKSGMDTATEPAQPGRESGFVPPPVEELRRLFPQLEILELIGKGGMGAVYKARQPALDRLVALKILPPGSGDDAGFAERFNREARALARLNHPHIVAVHDFGQVNRQPYLVMEFVDGPNLRQVEQTGRLTPEQALEIVPQICEALQFAHNEGVVHRDIKPENILLDKKGRVKITDFGIAKIVGVAMGKAALTGAKDLLGTPHYMAPEQVEKPAQVDHRADIYSLGVVFYELLTGELPLGRFQPPSKKVQVDVRLDEVVLHALEKEPERRYQQASQVKSDVETIASGGAPSIDEEAIAQARLEVNAPANWLVATGVLNWITIPFIMLVVASLGRELIRPALLWIVPVSAFVLTSVMILAGLKMKRLEAYRLAVLGSGLAIFMSPGNIIGLPAGIWSLVVLYRPDVQKAFAKSATVPQHKVSLPTPPGPHPDRFWRRLATGTAAGLLALILITIAASLLGIALPTLHHAKQEPDLTLTGTVCDAATGDPIPGARVDDTRYGPDRLPRQAWTDAGGRYELRTWYEEHSISASAPGYEPDLQTLLTKLFGREAKAQLNFRLRRINTAPSFGNATETVLPFGAPCENHYLQFRSGAIFNVGRGPGTTEAEYEEDWRRVEQAGGADVSAVRLQEGIQFVGEGCIFSQEPGLSWEATSASTALKQLRHASWVHGVVEPKSKDFPTTYLFRTAGGDSGLVQLLEVLSGDNGSRAQTPKGNGLRLRYKLVDPAPTPYAGAVSKGNAAARRRFVRLVVESSQMTFEGQPTTWEAAATLLAAVPHRTNTVLEFAVTTDQITVAQQNEWFQRAISLGRQLGFEYTSFVGIHALGSRGTTMPHRRTEPSSDGAASAARHTILNGVNTSAKDGQVVVESPEGLKLTAKGVKLGTNDTWVADGSVALQERSQELSASTIVFTVLTNGQGSRASIQAAVDAASPHTTIRIGPGRYEQQLVISKSLKLEGAGCAETVIGPTTPWTEPTPTVQKEAERRWRDAKTDDERRQLRREFAEQFSKPVLRIQGANLVQLRGLRFTQPGTPPDGKLLPSSVIEVRDAELVMRDCAIVGSPGNGLLLESSARAQVSRSLVAAAWNTGIVLKDAARAGIFDSDIRNCYYAAITIGRGLDHVIIKGCRISGAAWHGVRYDDASPTLADNLIFANARCGIYASGKTSAHVAGNVFWRNEMSGMSCWFENQDQITNNVFAANLREGLAVLGASVPRIERNIFWSNPQGVQQGNIGSTTTNGIASAKLHLRGNLFWTNGADVVSAINLSAGSPHAPAKLSLADFPDNLEAEPGFRNSAAADFALSPDGAAAKSGLRAVSVPVISAWPVQPEEQAMIPDGDTRDSRQWKRPGMRQASP